MSKITFEQLKKITQATKNYTDTELAKKSNTSHDHNSVYAPISHGTHVAYGTLTSGLTSGGTGIIGTSTKLSREDHTHTLPAYPTALKSPTALTLQFNGVTNQTYDGSSAKTLNITAASVGARPSNWVPAWGEVTGKPSTFAPSSHSHAEYVNQNAFSNIKIGTTIVSADSAISTLELIAGTNITLTPDETNDKVTITANHPSGLHVTQSEKDTWNAKETPSGAQSKSDKALSDAKAYADTKVANLVNGAPEQLDTLKELADAVAGNQAGVSDLLTQIGTKAATTYVNTELAKKSDNGHTHNYAGSSSVGGSANSALKLTTARAISISGAVSGSTNFDGSAGITISTSLTNLPSSKVSSLGGYAKPETVTTTVLDATDSLNSALGKIEKALDGKQASGNYAPSSHGNHVPATESANNSKFLRNDNSWAVVTPANIGAKSSSWVPSWTEVTDKPSTFTPTLGTTSSTAFRGDYGNTAYTHSQSAHAPSSAQKNSDITKAEIEAKLTGSISSHHHDSQYLSKTNVTTYVPTADYHPATKSYVDTTVANDIVSEADIDKLMQDLFGIAPAV